MQDFKRLLKYLRPHVLIFVIAFIAMILTALFEAASGAMIVPVIEQFTTDGGIKKTDTLFNLQELLPNDNWYNQWVFISVLLILFAFGKGIFFYLSTYLMARIGQTVILDLRQELYSHILNQSSVFFEKHRTNFLVSRLVVSCAEIENSVSSNLRDVLRESCMLLAAFGGAFYFSWRLMLGALIVGPIVAGITLFFSKALRKLAETSLLGNKRLNDTAQESLANHTIVKAYTAEEREKSRFTKAAKTIAWANLRSSKVFAASGPIIEIVGMFLIVTVFYFGLREINLNNMPQGHFFGFLFFLSRSYEPLRKLSRQHNEFSKAFAAAQDVWDIMDYSSALPEKENAVELKPLKDKISIRDISFHYQKEDKQVLENISLEIPKGAMIALVGESGGGKSSLIKLIQRFYDPTKGAILWDETNLRDAGLSSLRKQIALVTQETVLFNDTIHYNISYGKPDVSIEEIKEAAKIAFADEFIEELPDKYDTLIGERGIFLSGGQRQRLAIARAVLVDAPILILDEATSALDTESEKIVKKALANLMKNRTSIVIAHRLSTIRNADKIVVLQKGRIVEQGTHEELLEKGGVYKKLHHLQFEDDEAAK